MTEEDKLIKLRIPDNQDINSLYWQHVVQNCSEDQLDAIQRDIKSMQESWNLLANCTLGCIIFFVIFCIFLVLLTFH